VVAGSFSFPHIEEIQMTADSILASPPEQVSVTGTERELSITRASAHDFRWNLDRPITNGLHTYATADLTIVEVETAGGITGYGVGRPRPGERELRDDFLTQLIGLDASMTESIWDRLWSPKMNGRRGNETRALSSIDLALWDIKAKYAGMPLSRMLGGFRSEIPAYIAGGYYSSGKGLRELQTEFESYVVLGARAVKMKIGGASIREDVERVRAVREVIGDEVALMVDANCAYRYYDAIKIARSIEDYDPFWFEEPVQPDDYEGMAKIAAATSIPLATGENEYTKHGFRDLIATKSIAVLNPDARYMGGVTEFMKVAAMAQAHGLDISPHGDQQAHLQLLGAIPNASFMEFYPEQIMPMATHAYLNPPVLNSNGTVSVPDVPGAGMDPDFASLAPYRVR
jgi:L-alanine-DL-glutamate epimerase-like enolase superfamily enzyme